MVALRAEGRALRAIADGARVEGPQEQSRGRGGCPEGTRGLTPEEVSAVAGVIEDQRRTIEKPDIERGLAAIEQGDRGTKRRRARLSQKSHEPKSLARRDPRKPQELSAWFRRHIRPVSR
jgi:hypothetical protein